MSIRTVVDSGGRVDPQSGATFDEFVAARSRALLRTDLRGVRTVLG